MKHDFSWIEKRNAGIFAHISSLPSLQGIGNIGYSAQNFLEYLKLAKVKYWQICPLSPTSYGDSPYQSFSAYAGNTYFIDFRQLAATGVLDYSDLREIESLPHDHCDYGALYKFMPPLIAKAAHNFFSNKSAAKALSDCFGQTYEIFCKKNAFWLNDYALFDALKKEFSGASWTQWPKEFKNYNLAKKQKLTKTIVDAENTAKFAQWVFFSQYAKTKKIANGYGIEIIGDMPIFVAKDSADLWANPEIFDTCKDGSLRVVAGVGPDYFSPEGQLWGNPLYDWKNSYDKCLEFWKKRISKALEIYDVIRLDHFRAFADYWAVEATAKTALNGKWLKGPGVKFFDAIKKEFTNAKFIAEDLGLLSQAACDLRDELNIPAMAVLQFAFDSDTNNAYLPFNQKQNLVCYVGTHDNDTATSWYETASERAKDYFRRYFRTAAKDPNWDMIYGAMFSPAKIGIIMLQDILGLGGFARMNTPGKPFGNWQWRVSQQLLDNSKHTSLGYFRYLCEISGRAFVATNSPKKEL